MNIFDVLIFGLIIFVGWKTGFLQRLLDFMTQTEDDLKQEKQNKILVEKIKYRNKRNIKLNNEIN